MLIETVTLDARQLTDIECGLEMLIKVLGPGSVQGDRVRALLMQIRDADTATLKRTPCIRHSAPER